MVLFLLSWLNILLLWNRLSKKIFKISTSFLFLFVGLDAGMLRYRLSLREDLYRVVS